MIMRWIVAGFLIFVGILLVFGNTSRHLAVRRLLFLIFTLAGIGSLIFKDAWSKFAVSLGVADGVALLTYLVVFSFISYVISNYRWKRNFETKLVAISRQIAISEFLDKNPDYSDENQT